jgi:hypothetical protein
VPIDRHCEERSDEAIQRDSEAALDCFASLAMTDESIDSDHALGANRPGSSAGAGLFHNLGVGPLYHFLHLS